MNKQQIKKILMGLTVVYCLGAVGLASYHTWFSQNEEPVSHQEHPERPPLLAVGTPAPDFALTTTEGITVNIRDFQGERLVLLEIFATWCPHCQHSVPKVEALHKAFPDDLQIMAVNAGDPPGEMSTAKAFKDYFKIPYPIFDRPPEEFKKAYQLSGYPTFYLIGKDGKILWAYNGTLTDGVVTELKQRITENK